MYVCVHTYIHVYNFEECGPLDKPWAHKKSGSFVLNCCCCDKNLSPNNFEYCSRADSPWQDKISRPFRLHNPDSYGNLSDS